MSGRLAFRLRTVEAMVWLVLARLLIAAIPFRWWHRLLGPRSYPLIPMAPQAATAEPLVANVLGACRRLPIACKCLPQAMALAWMLRRRRRAYVLKIGARARSARAGEDALHAWLELDRRTVLGSAPGPWLVVLAAGA